MLFAYWNNTAAQLIFVTVYASGYYVLYHCAYKKHGTSLLAFYMLFGYPYEIINAGSKVANSGSPDAWVYFWFIIVYSGIFYFFGLKMRKVNKKIQIFSFISSDEYQKAIVSIRSAQNLDDLNFKYHEAFRECPGHFATVLSSVYEEMQQRLSSPAK